MFTSSWLIAYFATAFEASPPILETVYLNLPFSEPATKIWRLWKLNVGKTAKIIEPIKQALLLCRWTTIIDLGNSLLAISKFNPGRRISVENLILRDVNFTEWCENEGWEISFSFSRNFDCMDVHDANWLHKKTPSRVHLTTIDKSKVQPFDLPSFLSQLLETKQ
jgi:hypothetical protein